MKLLIWAAAAATLLATASEAQTQRPQRRAVTEAERQAARETLDSFSSPVLTRFGNDAEFHRYIAAVREFLRTRRAYYYSAASGIHFAQASPPAAGQPQAQADTVPPICPPDRPDCLEDEDDVIFVTGSRVVPSNPSITNNQRRGVEEGDIVKQIGSFLLVLQDGRIFVVDTRATGGRLALTDRADVYRDPRSDMWYDEMLVFGDRVLITGYSYDEGATEMAAFRLDERGRLSREGVFRLSSNDYYSDTNYATRLIGGNLVTYTPLRLDDLIDDGVKWPAVRRWLPEDDARLAALRARRATNRRAFSEDEEQTGGLPLIDAAGIYRPVRFAEEPVIHSVSVCPLDSIVEQRVPGCRTTALVGPDWPQWHVTESDVYLWTTSEPYGGRDECAPDMPLAVADSVGALLYRVPLSGNLPAVIAAHGAPPDQFALHADSRNLYALLSLHPTACYDDYDRPARLAYFSIPLDGLGAALAEAPLSAFTALPGTESRHVSSRFTDRYLVYGSLSRYRRYPTELDAYGNDSDYMRYVRDELRPHPAFAVPIDRPGSIRRLRIGHTVIRAERVADDIVLTGYRDSSGLSISLIDLDGRPRVASTTQLDGRYESEGRSHAFNSLVEPDGGGLMGLPTVPWIADSGREYWRSRASDLSFLAFGPRGHLRPIGELERRFDYVDDYDRATRTQDEDGVPGYECEVSCVDWYGNSRPIFTDGRIFALSGTELIEGRVVRGRIREVQRLNIALSSPLRE